MEAVAVVKLMVMAVVMVMVVVMSVIVITVAVMLHRGLCTLSHRPRDAPYVFHHPP